MDGDPACFPGVLGVPVLVGDGACAVSACRYVPGSAAPVQRADHSLDVSNPDILSGGNAPGMGKDDRNTQSADLYCTDAEGSDHVWASA